MWYLARGTGVVTLLLFTASLVLGIVHAERGRPRGTSRALMDAAHRSVSLLAVAFLGVHIVTNVIDPFAPIRLIDAVIPFTSAYRPLWLGLGTLAFDLLLAIAVTSLVRARLAARTWRGVHLLAYASWPVAVVHGLGTGTDVRQGWMLVIVFASVIAVLAALGVRLGKARGLTRPARIALLGGTMASLPALVLWLAAGPLASGWAHRAGTPAKLLGAAPVARRSAPAPPPRRAPSFDVSGVARVHRGFAQSGAEVLDILFRPGAGRELRLRLAGQAIQGGGLALGASSVTLRSGATYAGRITRLAGGDITSLVAAPDGRVARLTVQLTVRGSEASIRAASVPVTGQAG